MTEFIKSLQKEQKRLENIRKQVDARLAQKSYDEKIKKFVEKRLPQITRILQNYERDDMEKIYIREGKERQKWIHPVELTWEQRVDAWEKEEYVHKEFQEGTAIILTEKGERLILTFETGMSVLDIRMVKKFAEKYLL